MAFSRSSGTLTPVEPGDGTITDVKVAANAAIALSKLANVSATDRVLGRSSSGAGAIQEITCTSAGRALIDDADATAQRATLGLGTLATQSGTFSGTSSGTNTGDQTITLTGNVTGSGTGSFATTIANDAVTTARILNANVTTAKIADDAVTTAKILNANVTTAKIADANVTTAKIADANVTTEKIADGAITQAKLDSNALALLSGFWGFREQGNNLVVDYGAGSWVLSDYVDTVFAPFTNVTINASGNVIVTF